MIRQRRDNSMQKEKSRKLFVRIVAILLAGMMVLSALSAVIFS